MGSIKRLAKTVQLTSLSAIILASLAGCSGEAEVTATPSPVQSTRADIDPESNGETLRVEDNTDVYVGTPMEDINDIVVTLDALYMEATDPANIKRIEDIRSTEDKGDDAAVLLVHKDAQTLLISNASTTETITFLDKVASLKEFEEDGQPIDFVVEENVVVTDDTAIAKVGTAESGIWDINLVQVDNLWFIDTKATLSNGTVK